MTDADETVNLDKESQEKAKEYEQEIEQNSEKAIKELNESGEYDISKIDASLQDAKELAKAYGDAARAKPQKDDTEDYPNTGQPLQPDAGSAPQGTENNLTDDATGTPQETENDTIKDKINDAINNAVNDTINGAGNGGDGGDINNSGVNNNESANNNTNADEAPLNNPNGVYATDEMFRARHVVPAFWLTDRFKNTWKECMAGFNAAKEPGEMAEELFWGFINMGPKMIIAYMLHLEDQEVERKRSAQHDKEEYDQQLLLMKQLSPADFHKHKCDWVFGSEEFHQYLKEKEPNLPLDKYGYVDISNCGDYEKKQVRQHVENFINEEPYYKNMIENFTHREFGQDEISREAIGMSYAIHHINGKPQNPYKDGKPVEAPAVPTPPAQPDRMDALNAAATRGKRQNIQGQAQKGPLKDVTPANMDSLQQLGETLVSTLRTLNQQMKENGEILASIRNYQYNGIPFQQNTQRVPGRNAPTTERV